ncbi:MAG: hypothetical protein AAGE52_42020 [Myxococcota bacterium]
MKRKLLIGLFTFGTLAGFGSGIASVKHHHHRRAHFERHVAQLCVDAARRADARDTREGNPEAPR